MYITYNEFCTLYEAVDEKLFNRLNIQAARMMDRHTTGVDGVKKLKTAFPQGAEDALAVMHCAGSIVNLLAQIQEAEASAARARGYESTENGLHGKVISSVTAGNESISFSTASPGTSIDAAVKDPIARNRLIWETIREYLSGVKDSNGVNLLFMGPYPRL